MMRGVKLLMAMFGLDYFSASLLVAEIGDINRFSNDKRLVGWAGLAPSVRQSGDRIVRGRITRQGNRLVRWIMVEAAQTARFTMIGSRSSMKGMRKKGSWKGDCCCCPRDAEDGLFYVEAHGALPW
ncbi:MAG: IS110 family transposase [Candidatus Norongarragalinales archaeon]